MKENLNFIDSTTNPKKLVHVFTNIDESTVHGCTSSSPGNRLNSVSSRFSCRHFLLSSSICSYDTWSNRWGSSWSPWDDFRSKILLAQLPRGTEFMWIDCRLLTSSWMFRDKSEVTCWKKYTTNVDNDHLLLLLIMYLRGLNMVICIEIIQCGVPRRPEHPLCLPHTPVRRWLPVRSASPCCRHWSCSGDSGEWWPYSQRYTAVPSQTRTHLPQVCTYRDVKFKLWLSSICLITYNHVLDTLPNYIANPWIK